MAPLPLPPGPRRSSAVRPGRGPQAKHVRLGQTDERLAIPVARLTARSPAMRPFTSAAGHWPSAARVVCPPARRQAARGRLDHSRSRPASSACGRTLAQWAQWGLVPALPRPRCDDGLTGLPECIKQHASSLTFSMHKLQPASNLKSNAKCQACTRVTCGTCRVVRALTRGTRTRPSLDRQGQLWQERSKAQITCRALGEMSTHTHTHTQVVMAATGKSSERSRSHQDCILSSE